MKSINSPIKIGPCTNIIQEKACDKARPVIYWVNPDGITIATWKLHRRLYNSFGTETIGVAGEQYRYLKTSLANTIGLISFSQRQLYMPRIKFLLIIIDKHIVMIGITILKTNGLFSSLCIDTKYEYYNLQRWIIVYSHPTSTTYVKTDKLYNIYKKSFVQILPLMKIMLGIPIVSLSQ